MYSEIRISDRAEAAVIDIEGVIGVPEKMQFDKPGDRVATYERFTESVRAISAIDSARVIVNIRSTGGDVNDALLIYEALGSLGKEVTTRCYGYVASAATIIAQAASPGRREVSSTTLYLIHCSESSAEGNSGMLSRTVQLLDKTDERIAEIYALRSGCNAAAFALLMRENNGKGKWLSAEETLVAGLADKIIKPEKVTNDADPGTLTDSIDAVIGMLGITAIPEKEDKADGKQAAYQALKNLLNRIFNIQGKERKLQAVDKLAAGGAPDGVTYEMLPEDREVIFHLRDAQSRALPTQTLSREDPSIGEARRSSNEQAYHEDSLSLRNK